jgi:GTP-binding protein
MPFTVAILGRPNVGKSTLFNRLVGRRAALVDDAPGVTRDRREGEGRIADLEFRIIDTAGLEEAAPATLAGRMRAQTERSLAQADVVLLLIDARAGITDADRHFGGWLRKSGKPVVLVANKAEGRSGLAAVGEAYALGLGDPVPLSAAHGEGFAELYDRLRDFAPLPDAPLPDAPPAEEPLAEEPGERPLQLAIVGRPNVGKSTLVNRLVGEDRLLTGAEPGITRDSIALEWRWRGRPIRLVDTAGLRRKARVIEALEKLSTHDAIRAITFAEVVILVMDATHPFETQDVQIADLVEREGRALVFVLAKWDLIEDPGERLKACRETAERMLPQLRGTPLVALSAETGRGLASLMPAVAKAHADWSTKVRTSDLNTWLKLAVEKHPPPMVKGRRIRAKYIAQTKARPPTFVLMASRAAALPDSYKRYLVNSIRQSFDLPGTPIRLIVRAGANPYADESSGARATVKPKRSAARPSSRKTAPKPSAGRGPPRPRAPRS